MRTQSISIAFCVCAPWLAQAQLREIVVDVSLKDKDGVALTDLTVGVTDGLSRTGGKALGPVDQQGHVQLKVNVDVQCKSLYVLVSSEEALSEVLTTTRLESAAWQRYERLVQQEGLKRFYTVNINAVAMSYSTTVQLPSVVGVQGTVVGLVDPSSLIVTLEHSASDFNPNTVGRFNVSCAPKASDAILWLFQGESGYCQRVPVPASLSNVDLGEIAWNGQSGTTPVTITMSGRESLPYIPSIRRRMVTCISPDGSSIFEFILDRNGVARDTINRSLLPTLPPGIYYVSAGSASRGGSESLIQTVLDGSIVDLEAASYPKIVVPEEGTAELSFNGHQAAQIVDAIVGIK